jgi:hypothetical protein
MFPFSSLICLAVLVSVIASMILGMLWYGPLFGNTWMKLVGLTKKDTEKDMAKTMAMGLINTFITIAGLSLLLTMMNITETTAGLQVGALVWLAFIATNNTAGVIWAKMPWKLCWINSFYSLAMIELSVFILLNWA